MKTFFPDYKNGLTSVMSSIQKYFGVESNHPSLYILDKYLNQTKYKNVVLVLFDGFGYNILRKNSKHCEFLNKHLISVISSTFPSTTMAARTTIESGLNPIEHGWLGWNMYFKKFDEVITLSKNYVKGTKKKITDYHIAKTLLGYKSVVDKMGEANNCNSNKVTLYSTDKNNSFYKVRKNIKKVLNNNYRNYVYFYCDEPDHTFHKYGCNSKQALRKIRKINKEFKRLCYSLKDTLVIALADHGHLDIEYITLTDYPEILKMLKGDVSIDCRACSFRVKDEYKKEFPTALKNVLKDDFIILSGKEVHDKRLFGTGKENNYYFDALGDYFAIGITNKAIRSDDKVNMHKSSHSGITEDEMLVPLIVYGKGN